tara:strand:- start:20 stop:1000 length:981 start_codon:yes stop_codon:yes gene_type:complete
MTSKKNILISCLALSACGTPNRNADRKAPGIGQRNDNAIEATVSIPVDVSRAESFSLTAATDFKMALVGCISGNSEANITAAKPSIDLYLDDKECIVELINFTTGIKTWVASADRPFTSYASGDSAIFENTADPSETMQVRVSSQVSSPIKIDDTVSYYYSQLQEGSDEVIEKPNTANNHGISVGGATSPGFSISSLSFSGIGEGGAGQFLIKMDCNSVIDGSDTNATCESLPFKNIKYTLVADEYAGSPNITQLKSIFTNPTQTIDAPEVLLPGEAGTTNGGFTTKKLTGPPAMHLNPNMLLILEANTTSYLYFNLDVAQLSYLK